MEKRTREILALVLLLVLGIGIGCAMAWYIMVGHNWNITATHIDDYVGEMEDYTVILYEGSTPHSEMTGVGELVFASQDEDNASSKNAGKSSPEPSDSSNATSTELDSKGSSTAAKDDTEAKSADVANPEPITVNDVARSYRDKDASVLVLDTNNLAEYDEPQILLRGSNRIGVFSVDGKMEYADFMSKVVYLKRHEVDMVVGITADRSFSKLKFHGADVVIFACNAFIPAGGIRLNGAFCCDSPYEDEVQALIVSPSKVITAKSIKEL